MPGWRRWEGWDRIKVLDGGWRDRGRLHAKPRACPSTIPHPLGSNLHLPGPAMPMPACPALNLAVVFEACLPCSNMPDRQPAHACHLHAALLPLPDCTLWLYQPMPPHLPTPQHTSGITGGGCLTIASCRLPPPFCHVLPGCSMGNGVCPACREALPPLPHLLWFQNTPFCFCPLLVDVLDSSFTTTYLRLCSYSPDTSSAPACHCWAAGYVPIVSLHFTTFAVTCHHPDIGKFLPVPAQNDLPLPFPLFPTTSSPPASWSMPACELPTEKEPALPHTVLVKRLPGSTTPFPLLPTPAPIQEEHYLLKPGWLGYTGRANHLILVLFPDRCFFPYHCPAGIPTRFFCVALTHHTCSSTCSNAVGHCALPACPFAFTATCCLSTTPATYLQAPLT